MWRFQYHREQISESDWVERCNDLGAEGWSLHSMRWVEGSDAPVCFFKRTITSEVSLFRRPDLMTPKEREKLREYEAEVAAMFAPGGRMYVSRDEDDG